ncbi:type I DNA polymerase [Escherichia phage myPSH1131]|uniref:Type I DNA polymerase n=1 Tax=Escherichia phage myPSH1131 TaxID=2108117 RepID=A0A2R3UA52_9CAUD|nr:type I DNA polymerase [Escherichia phage myPSH1131]
MFTYCEHDVNLTVKVYLFFFELTGFDPYDPPSLYWKM